jgi:hydrogenase maturation protease
MTLLAPGGTPPRILVLGYGNPGRQDDGLGPAVAAGIERLGWPNLTAFDNYQLNIEDAMDVAEHDVVWFVDATRTGSSPYAVHEVAPASSIEFTSHLVRPEAILAIAHQCYGKSPQAFMLAIRGYEFAFIEALTPGASANLREALAMLTGRIRASQVGARS